MNRAGPRASVNLCAAAAMPGSWGGVGRGRCNNQQGNELKGSVSTSHAWRTHTLTASKRAQLLLLQELISPVHSGYGVGGTTREGRGLWGGGGRSRLNRGRGGGVETKVTSQSLANLSIRRVLFTPAQKSAPPSPSPP